MIQTFTTNIRLPDTNNLAYFAITSMQKKKHFIASESRVNVINLFFVTEIRGE
jgi:hypothetical protein